MDPHDQSVYVAALYQYPIGPEYRGVPAIIKYNSSGKLIWSSLDFQGNWWGDWLTVADMVVSNCGYGFVSGAFRLYSDPLLIGWGEVGFRTSTGDFNSVGSGGTPLDSRPLAMAIGLHCHLFTTGYGGSLESGADFLTEMEGCPPSDDYWTAWYDGPQSGPDQATAIAVDSHGDAYVTGESGYYNLADIATVKYDGTTGRQVWVQRLDGPGHGLDKGVGVAVAADGAAYVVGTVDIDQNPDNHNTDIVLIKYARWQ